MGKFDEFNLLYDPVIPVPLPKQAPATEGFAEVNGTRLWYWDTGGDGEPIILVHPASGSALIWEYQQPVFVEAGYRVIAYSRRGYYKSGEIDEKDPGTASGDLKGLVDHLKLDKFHLLGSAAGGSVVADFAVSFEKQLLSLIVSSNSVGQRRGYIADHAVRVRPKEWDGMPVWFREISPAYRGANPEGVQKWVDLNAIAVLGSSHRQNSVNDIGPDTLETLTVPTLLLTGASDMSTPSSLLRMIAKHIQNSELLVGAEAGHSFYWERPELFNAVVLDFIKRHPNK